MAAAAAAAATTTSTAPAANTAVVVPGAPPALSTRAAFSADGQAPFGRILLGDEQYFLVCERLYVRVFAADTALPIAALGPHPATVSGIAAATSAFAESAHHIWSACLDGILRLWDICDGEVVCTLPVNRPVTALVALELPVQGNTEDEGPPKRSNSPATMPTKPASVYVLAVACAKANISLPPPADTYSNCLGSILLIVPKIPRTRGETAKALSKAHIGKTKAPVRLLRAAMGRYLLFVESTRVRIFRTHLSRSEQKQRLLVFGREVLRLRHTRALTVCAASEEPAFHNGVAAGSSSTEGAETMQWPRGYVAAGDLSGRLLVWNLRLIMEKGSRVGKVSASSKVHVLSSNEATTNHWHAKAISAICFGAYDTNELFTSGFEAVLVRWKLSDGSRTFLPRLGLPPLSSLALNPINPTILLILCGDAALRLVNTGTMTVTHSVQANTYAFDTIRGALVAPTAAGTIQFFDAIKGRHLLEVSVPASPGVSACDTQPPDPKPMGEETWDFDDTASYVHARNVHIVAYSAKGVLATGAADGSAIHIFQDTTKSSGVPYRLICEILYPHSRPISFLAFTGDGETLVSSSLDGSAKLWIRQDHGWVCRSICYYRNEPITAAALSDDESVLVLGHTTGLGTINSASGASLLGNCISVWNVFENALIAAIPLDMPHGVVYQILVVEGKIVVVSKADDGHIARAAPEHVIAVYDIFSRKLLWSRCLPNSVTLGGTCMAIGRHSILLPLRTDKFVEQGGFNSENSDPVFAREPLNIAVELTTVARAWQLPRMFSLVEAVVPIEYGDRRGGGGVKAQYIVVLEGREIAILWDDCSVAESDNLIEVEGAENQRLDNQDFDHTMSGLRPISVSTPSSEKKAQSGDVRAEEDGGYSTVTGLVQSLRLTPSHLLPQPASLLDDFLLQVS